MSKISEKQVTQCVCSNAIYHLFKNSNKSIPLLLSKNQNKLYSTHSSVKNGMKRIFRKEN